MGFWDRLFRRSSVNPPASDASSGQEKARRELMAVAGSIIDRKQFVDDFDRELKEAVKLPEGTGRDAAIGRLTDSLRMRMNVRDETEDYFARCEELYRDFLDRLTGRFPALSGSERRLSLLLRQGFQSKDMASLLGITPKSVEISRYRLRAKLGLSGDDNPTGFIKTI